MKTYVVTWPPSFRLRLRIFNPFGCLSIFPSSAILGRFTVLILSSYYSAEMLSFNACYLGSIRELLYYCVESKHSIQHAQSYKPENYFVQLKYCVLIQIIFILGMVKWTDRCNMSFPVSTPITYIASMASKIVIPTFAHLRMQLNSSWGYPSYTRVTFTWVCIYYINFYNLNYTFNFI